MHIYAVNNFEEIVESQIEKMEKSGLYKAADKIYYGVVLNREYYINDEKFSKLYCSLDKEESEVATINCINKCFGEEVDNRRVFYVHTKGVTKPYWGPHNDWRTYMEYFILERYETCVAELERADVVGVNWHFGQGWRGARPPAAPHFNGNFWWANLKYLQKLPELNEETSLYQDFKPGIKCPTRWDAEFWLGRENPTVVELWNSRVHHGTRPYPESKYRGKAIHPKVVQ
jgi:hypothetical protein